MQFCTVCGRSAADDAPAAPASWSSPQPGPDPWQVPPSGPAPWQVPQPGPDPWQVPPAGPPPRQYPPGQGRSRKPLPFILGGIAVLVVGGLAAAYFVVKPFHAHQAAAISTPPPATTQGQQGQQGQGQAQGQPPPTPGQSSSSSVPAEEQAAAGLATLLKQSVTDRNSIVQAVNDVEQCGPNLNQDPQTFQAAASSRDNLLSQLASLPQRSALPANMLADLTTAWQSSVKADQDFAEWARDEISKGCTQNDESDPGAQAAQGPDAQATTSKQAFTGLWNPIASQYGLPTYQWNQL